MSQIYREACRVLENRQLVPGIFSLWLQAPQIARAAQPGQFVNMYCQDRQKLLPRPVSICEISRQEGRIRLVFRVTGPGTGTEEFSRLRTEEPVRVMGPLGNGFPLREAAGKRVLLVGGGIGIPPMLQTARELSASGILPDAMLGYRDRLFLDRDFSACAKVYLATEDGSAGYRGTVLDGIHAADLHPEVIFACGPRPMLRALSEYAREADISCWISMEERMACGIGACLGCVCETVRKDSHSMVHNRRVCADGPVFECREVVL